MTLEKTKSGYQITLDELKDHLSIDHAYIDQDNLLSKVLGRSYSIAEKYIEKDILETANVLTDTLTGSSYIINEGNLESVDEVTIDGNVVTPTLTKYTDWFELSFDSSHTNAALVVNFTTGFISLSQDLDIEAGILVKCGELYDQDRSGYVIGSLKQTNTFENLLSYYKRKINASS